LLLPLDSFQYTKIIDTTIVFGVESSAPSLHSRSRKERSPT
jgi:hypothetical protein